MRLIKSGIELEFQGEPVFIDLFEDDFRSGTKSPKTWYYWHYNRWVTPFERRVRGWPDLPMSVYFVYMYGDAPALGDLVYTRNPLLEMITKEPDGFRGAYISVPLQTPGH